MKLEGSYTFNAPREIVWDMLQDPEVLAKILPGCQKLEKVGEDAYKGKLKIKIGPVQGVFQGDVELTDLQPPRTYNMKVKGRGPSGIVDGTGTVELESEGENKTVMNYLGDAKVSGKIASVGQRLMDSSAKAITKQSLENLERQVDAKMGVGDEDEADTAEPQSTTPAASNGAAQKPSSQSNGRSVAPTEVPPPSQTEFALGVAKEMVNDFVPEEQQRWVFGGLGLVAAVVLFNWWSSVIARRVASMLKEE